MKKTVKKITALILTVLLIIPLISVQGFALFDKITDVKITQKETLTERYLNEYIALLEEFENLTEEDYFYYVSVKTDVTISTGETISSDELGIGISENQKRSYFTQAYVDIRDYQRALREGKDTIPLYYEITLLSSIDIELDKFRGESEISFVECIIKELIPVSGIPTSWKNNGIIWSILDEELNQSEKEFLLEGAVFDIVFPDGSVKRDTVKTVEGEKYTYEELDGEEIEYWVDDEEGLLEIYYKDAYLSLPIEIIPYPIADIRIDEVKVSDAFEAESVTYTVTKPDGSTVRCTTDLSGAPAAVMLDYKGYLGETIDEAPVLIYVSKTAGDEYPPRDYITVTVVADVSVMDMTEIEGPEQEGTALGALIYKIISFIRRLLGNFLFVI